MLIVPRRPNPSLNRNASHFLICPNCSSFHTITNLRNHFVRCTGGAIKGARNIKILARKVEGRMSSDASEQLREIIPVMKEDQIVKLIRYDWLLIAHGNILCMKYSYHFQQNMIRAKLRLAGRVLHALKTINTEVTDFASIYHPKRYKSLIEAIKIVGKYDSSTNEFGSPATSASAITAVKQIGRILKLEYMEKENAESVKRTKNFLFLMDSEFSSIINKRVKECQMKRRRDKDHKIPSKEDVRLLAMYVKSERDSCLEALTANFSFVNWVKLSKLTIASIIVFNRRRTGESQNILVSDFEKRESMNRTSNQELFESLSEESKKVAKRYSRMKIRGKKGSNVNVLLRTDISSCIELLLSHRLEAGVPSYNPFLFALPSPPCENRIRVINACTVLASLSKLCGAEDPTTLRGTNLRKHFASACMAKELDDAMVSEVAKFLGHRESVHREHYRHNTLDREVVKMVKLLKEAQGFDEDDSDDDDSDSDSESSDSEDYITLPKSALYIDSNTRRTINKKVIAYTPAASQKRKKKMQEVRPPPTSTSQTSRKLKPEHTVQGGGKFMKTERNSKNKVSVTAVSVPYTGKKRQKTGKNGCPGKSDGKRKKIEGSENSKNKLNEVAASVPSVKRSTRVGRKPNVKSARID